MPTPQQYLKGTLDFLLIIVAIVVSVGLFVGIPIATFKGITHLSDACTDPSFIANHTIDSACRWSLSQDSPTEWALGFIVLCMLAGIGFIIIGLGRFIYTGWSDVVDKAASKETRLTPRKLFGKLRK